MTRAPFFDDIANGPAGGEAHWLTTADGLKIRAAHWVARGETLKGTILLFPGRTEYIEKYGPAAAEFLARGYAMVAIDWRGQGIADRTTNNRFWVMWLISRTINTMSRPSWPMSRR